MYKEYLKWDFQASISIFTSFLLKTYCLNGHPTVIRQSSSQGSTEQQDVEGTLSLTFEASST